MRLRTLAGAYAGLVRDYSVPAGLAAIRSGTAARLDEDVQPPARRPASTPSQTATRPARSVRSVRARE